ncbi:MAG: hypothetical protein K6F98_00870 [Bacteroidales bacterium]|nr:hypothetical protein [Bacteroidales bacterium]
MPSSKNSFPSGLPTLQLPHIQTVSKAADIPGCFARTGLAYTAIDTVNWPGAFPEHPEAWFAAAHDGRRILLHFKVQEALTGARTADDDGPVWEDSCVEFFCAPDGDGYYNLECNCIGRLHLAYGSGRENRTVAPAELTAQIDRWTSLGHDPFPLRHVPEWELALAVPAEAFFRQSLSPLSGRRMKGNVYGMGGRPVRPHYLSLFPVHSEKPDFHRPEYFSDFVFL